MGTSDDELHTALGELETLLAKGTTGQVRLTDDGELIIPPLTAEDVPAEADVLRTELAGHAAPPTLYLPTNTSVLVSGRSGMRRRSLSVGVPVSGLPARSVTTR